MLATRGDTITMFSNKSISLENPTSGKRDWPRKISDAVSMRIKGPEWERVKKNLPLSAAYSPTLCDPFNQLDITISDKLRAVLPQGAKIKLVRDESQGLKNLAFAVYSTMNGVGPAPPHYDVRVALLKSASTGDYALLGTDLASDYGMFCGIVQGADADHWYILMDEPSGSSDYLAVYVYAIVQ